MFIKLVYLYLLHSLQTTPLCFAYRSNTAFHSLQSWSPGNKWYLPIYHLLLPTASASASEILWKQ